MIVKRRTPEGEQIAVAPGEISGLFQAPAVAAEPRDRLLASVRGRGRPGRARLAAGADPDDRPAGDHRRNHRRRLRAGGRPSDRSAGAARGRNRDRLPLHRRDRRPRRVPGPEGHQHRGGRAQGQPPRRRRQVRRLGQGPRCRRRQRRTTPRTTPLLGQQRRRGDADRAHRRDRPARLARRLPLLHRPQPLLPAQGLADDRRLGRAPRRPPGAARPRDAGKDRELAAGVLPRGHDRRRLERVDRGRRSR